MGGRTRDSQVVVSVDGERRWDSLLGRSMVEDRVEWNHQSMRSGLAVAATIGMSCLRPPGHPSINLGRIRNKTIHPHC